MHSKDRLLSSGPRHLNKIANRWAPDLDVHPIELADQIIAAVINGEFDSLPSGRCGVRQYDHDAGKHWGIAGREWAAAMREAEQPVVEGFRLLAKLGGVILTREAVQSFANTRGLPAPSFWPADWSEQQPPSRNVSESDLRQYLTEDDIKPLTRPEQWKRCKEHFHPRGVPRKLFESALPDKGRVRGVKSKPAS